MAAAGAKAVVSANQDETFRLLPAWPNPKVGPANNNIVAIEIIMWVRLNDMHYDFTDIVVFHNMLFNQREIL